MKTFADQVNNLASNILQNRMLIASLTFVSSFIKGESKKVTVHCLPDWIIKQNRRFNSSFPFIIEPAREQAFVGHTFKKAQVVMVLEGEV